MGRGRSSAAGGVVSEHRRLGAGYGSACELRKSIAGRVSCTSNSYQHHPFVSRMKLVAMTGIWAASPGRIALSAAWWKRDQSPIDNCESCNDEHVYGVEGHTRYFSLRNATMLVCQVKHMPEGGHYDSHCRTTADPAHDKP